MAPASDALFDAWCVLNKARVEATISAGPLIEAFACEQGGAAEQYIRATLAG